MLPLPLLLLSMSTLPCSHRSNRFFCKTCKGNGICKHDKTKYKCRQCNPKASGVCPHNRSRSCKLCASTLYTSQAIRDYYKIHDKRPVLPKTKFVFVNGKRCDVPDVPDACDVPDVSQASRYHVNGHLRPW